MSGGEQIEEVPYSLTFEGRIAADRIPELLDVLSRLSVEQTVRLQVGEPSSPAAAEAEGQVPTLERQGYVDFATEHGYSVRVAGGSWNQLIRGYSNVVHGTDTLNFPVRFRRHPGANEHGKWWESEYRLVGGLELPSLGELVARLEGVPDDDIASIAGPLTGPKTVALWREIVAGKLGG